MSLVLYRKYRPKTFTEVVGQEHIVKTLTNAIASGMISHAYLFTGPRGTGKTTLGRLLAKALNCQNRKEGEYEPCNQCDSCQEINKGNSIDMIEIDAASNRGIDEMRDLKEGIRFAPAKSKYKVFIIDECHQLTKEANNALLKTLEEPPSHAIFVLATTEIHKMIPTIISRCQRFDFKKLTLQEIIKKLEFIAKKEEVKIEKRALELIALNAAGSVRDAESIFGQILTFEDTAREIKAEEVKDLLGLVEINLISQLFDFLSQKKASEALNFLNDIIEKGVDLQEFTKSLINYLRQTLILKITGLQETNPIITGLTKEEFQKMQKQTESFKEEELLQIINLFLEAENKMKYSSILQLPLELAIIEAIEPIE
ncbi:MAG: DNA polymerase III subunit gamma/tau [Candidatus Nealsonbacteria bacterium]|nr:DNA polymerase III subunit gamma/tau [Candidatus Nealsonbacteria bacterium]